MHYIFEAWLPDGLCIDIILGTDFQKQDENAIIACGGSKLPISFVALTTMSADPPPLFANLTVDCKLIVANSTKYLEADQDFTSTEVKNLAESGIIESSNSPWRAQVVVVNEKSKSRMVVDYSETMYTHRST